MSTRDRTTATTDRASSQSSDKVLHILECIAQSPFPLRLQDLSKQLGMSQSTILRYLNALMNANYVYQESDTSRYGLTWKICGLGQNLNSHLSLRTIASPFVNRLSGEFGLGSCLVVDHNFECMYLDFIDTPGEFSQTLRRIGRSAPLHTTGSGKILLSSYCDAKIDEYIVTRGLVQLTEHTIVTRERLFEEINTIRAQGYGMDEEECETGLRCISVPLYCYTGKIYAALSVFGNPSVLTLDRIDSEILPILREVSAIISMRLGYTS